MNAQAGGVGSDPLRTRLAVPFVLITGGKGGVGKTTVALNLALALAERGRRVLLCDFDFGLANLHVAFGFEPAHTLEDHLAGRRALKDCTTLLHGLTLLPAGSGTAEMARPDSARRALLWRGLAELSRGFDLVLADSAAGIGPDVLYFASAADYALLVTEPDPAALADAYGVLKGLSQFAEQRHLAVPTPELLINAAGSPQEAEAIGARLGAVSQRFLNRSPRLAGWLPRSAEVQASARAQIPLLVAEPECLTAQALRRLAERVERQTGAPALRSA